MKLFIQSDLHYDYYCTNRKVLSVDEYIDRYFLCADVVVLPGDIASDFYHAKEILVALCRVYPNVVFCLGNHDLSVDDDNGNFAITLDKICAYRMLEDEYCNLHLLDGDVVEISGVKFGGATGLWDYCNAGNRSKAYIDEYWLMKWHDGKSWNLFENNLDRIREYMMSKVDDVLSRSPDIMVSHYSPLLHRNSKYSDNIASVFYYFDSSLMNAVRKNGGRWCAGHTHSAYLDGSLAINPVGYPHEIVYTGNLSRESFLIEV